MAKKIDINNFVIDDIFDKMGKYEKKISFKKDKKKDKHKDAVADKKLVKAGPVVVKIGV